MTTTPLLPGFKESFGLEFPLPIIIIVVVEAVPSVVLEFLPPIVVIVEVEAVPSVVLVLEIVTGIMATRSADKSVASIIRDNFESTTIMVELQLSRSTVYLLSNINSGSQWPFRHPLEESCVELDVRGSRT